MIDYRPLLFANFLAIMLLVTAGFATIQRSPELVGSRIPAVSPSSSGETQTSAGDERAPADRSQASADRIPRVIPAVSVPDTGSSSENTPDDARAEMAADSQPTAGGKAEQKKKQQPTQARLTLRSNVYDDQVRINGKPRGSTAMDLELAPGTYTIEISKPKHSTWRERIHLDAGDSPTLMARLERYTTVRYRNGTWEHGVKTGEGTYRDSDGLTYEGEFRNGEFHGEGTAHFPDGRIYEGEWRQGTMHGEGNLQRPNGDVYEGDFQDGEYHGRGTLTASNGDTFTGNWEDGELNGHGTLTTAEGLMYVGDFRDGELHGEGRLTYPNGGYYRGEFANDRFHGEGVRTFSSGRQYRGQFVDGRFHGEGEIRHPSGASIESTFREGEPYGEVRMTTPEGEVFIARTSEPGVCYRKGSYRETQCPSMEAW
ncbi:MULTISPECIES: MORN repeat-containing protein [Gammaproteobacteria]|uniref:PEGA domain-containing protein n=1 Tax=Vreelandella halophila TaxID=86177 RepID=A0A9X4YD54_9GAMM|nr:MULTISPECIES: PEGA domain-containing protein [Gammaproteobacteria]KAA8984325.1 PEGA domain-containing protein [Halospina sp. K52047b]MYL26948.1 PEGA domain-containing protein [Halomonas utahensis]MYL74209.1 PEGA domain-containing protein [Halomonas sp. 22501_18_FS]